jgi:hypothetical protein
MSPRPLWARSRRGHSGRMRFTKTLTFAALALVVLCAAPAVAAVRKPVNGTYAAVSTGTSQSGGPLQLVTLTVSRGVVSSASWFTQPFVGYGSVSSPTVGAPTTTTFGRTRISRTGKFTLPIPLTAGGATAGGCLTGVISGRKVTLNGYGTQNGTGSSSCSITSFYGIQMRASGPLSPSPPANGTYTGTSTQQQGVDPDGPFGPPSGPVGTVSLTVFQGAIASGTGSFTPVNPTTGATVAGAPAVAVTYGTGSIDPFTGLFSVASTPSGYDLCGGFTASGVASALVSCRQSSYLPAALQLASPSMT